MSERRYERVKNLLDLRQYDEIRLTTSHGDILTGTIEFTDHPVTGERQASYFRTAFGTMSAEILSRPQYTLEVAVDFTRGGVLDWLRGHKA